MQKFIAFMVSLLFAATSFGGGLECQSTVAQGSKKISINYQGDLTNLSKIAFGPCSGPPPTCRPVDFSANLRAALAAGNQPLGEFHGENGRQVIDVQLLNHGSLPGTANGIAHVSLNPVMVPIKLDVSCVPN